MNSKLGTAKEDCLVHDDMRQIHDSFLQLNQLMHAYNRIIASSKKMMQNLSDPDPTKLEYLA